MNSNIYGYARVSSKDQNSIRQVEAFKNIGIRDENIYVDHASGKDFERTEYQNLKDQLQPNDLLVIKSIDRLGRNYDEIIQEWKVLTKDIQANIKVLDLPLLDTTTSGKDLTGTFISDIVLQILSYVAEQERINIRQRQAEGIALAKAQGKHLGRPRIECPPKFDETYIKWKTGSISLEQALKTLGLKRSIFYRFASQCKNHSLQGTSSFRNISYHN